MLGRPSARAGGDGAQGPRFCGHMLGPNPGTQKPSVSVRPRLSRAFPSKRTHVTLSALRRYETSRKTSSHDDSIWAVTWPTDDKLITGSIDETVKVRRLRARVRERGSRTDREMCVQNASRGPCQGARALAAAAYHMLACLRIPPRETPAAALPPCA